MKRILVVIDMQNDFITGALPADGGVEIVPRIVDKIKNNNYDHYFFTEDFHFLPQYLDTIEGENIPFHCAFGSEGANFVDKIADLSGLENTHIVSKNSFGSFRLNGLIKYYVKENEKFEIELCGVCTDICVVSNALILRTAFPNARIIVDSNCCAGTTKEAHEAALTVMKNCLIEVI